jgi:hypothetical protein
MQSSAVTTTSFNKQDNSLEANQPLPGSGLSGVTLHISKATTINMSRLIQLNFTLKIHHISIHREPNQLGTSHLQLLTALDKQEHHNETSVGTTASPAILGLRQHACSTNGQVTSSTPYFVLVQLQDTGTLPFLNNTLVLQYNLAWLPWTIQQTHQWSSKRTHEHPGTSLYSAPADILHGSKLHQQSFM